MQINGKEIRFSISNKNHAANFEKAIRAMEKDEERIRKMSQGKLGDVLDALIRMGSRYAQQERMSGPIALNRMRK